MKKLGLLLIAIVLLGCEKENIPPTCEITSPGNDAEYEVGDLITISVEAEDEDGTIEEVSFYIDDLGVGSVTSFPFNYIWDTESEEDGIKKIKVSVKDDRGATVEDEISILLNPGGEPPVASFTSDKTSISEGESVQFTDQSTNEPTSWEWDFGDGESSAQQNPSHVYSTAGNFTVSLQVTNQYGSNTETKTSYITVTESGGGETDTFTDARDGKTYKTVKIGTQTWMAENLAYLPSVGGPETGSYTTPYHYVYSYNGTSVSEAKTTSNYKTYGVLYNWPAALNACPSGWHLPTDAEWKTLEMHLGMSQAEADVTDLRGTDEGGKLKETGTTHWNSPNEGATNESGFTALPGGYRYFGGSFHHIGDFGFWWSATEYDTDTAWRRNVDYANSGVYRYNYYKETGISVRCLRDD